MSNDTATFLIPVTWETVGLYKVKANGTRQALSKVVLTDRLPEQREDDISTFQITIQQLAEMNDIISPKQVDDIIEEIQKDGWEGFAADNIHVD